MALNLRPHSFEPRGRKLGLCTLILSSDLNPTLML